MNSNMIEGSWKVDKFILNGSDKTKMYSSVRMRFSADGFLQLEDNDSIMGAWKISKQATSDAFDRYLEFAISLPHPFNDLAGFWDVFSEEKNKVEMILNDSTNVKELNLIR